MNKLTLSIKDSSLAFIIGFIICQLGTVVLTMIAMVVSLFFGVSSNSFLTFTESNAIGYLMTTVFLDLMMFLVFFFFNRKKDNKIFKKVQFYKIFLCILISITAYFLLFPIIDCLGDAFVSWGIPKNQLGYTLNTTNYFVSIISLVILPPIFEELLFRGLIFKGLKKHGKIFSIVISALMFSLFHSSIHQAVYPFLIGLVLGYVMYEEDNIIYPIIIHMTNNFLSITLSYFSVELFSNWILAIILLAIFLFIIFYLIFKNNKNTKNIAITKTEMIYLSASIGIMLIIWIAYNIMV